MVERLVISALIRAPARPSRFAKSGSAESVQLDEADRFHFQFDKGESIISEDDDFDGA